MSGTETGPGGSGQEAPRQSGLRKQISARIQIYNAVRAASDSVAGTTRTLDPEELDRRFHALQARIRAVAVPIFRSKETGEPEEPAAFDSELTSIDRELSDLADEIRTRVSEMPLARLRAVLPQRCTDHRDDVCALLDLLLVDQSGPLHHWELIDYLVTLLATEDQRGKRCVVHNPTQLTRQLSELCTGWAAGASEQTDRLARAFDAARIEVLEGEAVWEVVDRMRPRKEQSQGLLLVPDVLSNLVAYNVAVWNRLEQITDTTRMLGNAERIEVEALERGEEPAPAPEPGSGSGIDSRGLCAIEEAIRARLHKHSLPEDLAGEIVRGDEHFVFTRFERGAFQGSLREPVGAAVRAAIAIGVALRQRPELVARLGELDIDVAELRRDWVQEIDDRLGAAVRDCFSGDQYDDARQIAEVRTRFLHGSRGEGVGWQLEHGPESALQARPGSREERGERPQRPQRERRATTAPDRGRTASAARRGDAAARRGRRAVDLEEGGGGQLRLVVLLGALAIAIAFRVAMVQPSTVHELSGMELQAVSPYLESAYRSGKGHGPLFVGMLKGEWQSLPDATQVEQAQRIGDSLRHAGVSELMLVDGRRKLEVHYRGGQLVYPASGD